jgi:hypothetical protein
MTALALASASTAPAVATRDVELPLLLVTTAHPSMHEHPGPLGEAVHPHLGRLLQPRHFSSVELTAAAGIPWAADNDCFQGLDPHGYCAMLDRLHQARIDVAGGERRGERWTDLCKFVTVPDRVGDAWETARMFEQWAPAVERRGLPVGLVLQNGIERPALQRWLARSWHRIDAVFVGGDDEFKLGPIAAQHVQLAKRDGKWVHWGRVNSLKRMRYCTSTGACDSMDGSSWAKFRHALLDKGLAWCAQVAEEGPRFDGWQLELAVG